MGWGEMLLLIRLACTRWLFFFVGWMPSGPVTSRVGRLPHHGLDDPQALQGSLWKPPVVFRPEPPDAVQGFRHG